MLQLQKIAMLANAGAIMESLSIAIIIQREKSWLKWPNRFLWSSQRDLIHVVELDGRHSLITGTWICCCRTIDLTLICFFRAIWVNYPGYSWENGYLIYEKWREPVLLVEELPRNSLMSNFSCRLLRGNMLIGWLQQRTNTEGRPM